MKTDNVLVGHDARVAITDFGIARALEGGDAEPSGTGQLIGTPAYMAPEQARGHGRIDTRADLYALGIVLFQMLTGQLPFACRSGLEAALVRLYQNPLDPRDLRPHLPKALSEIMRRCLAREPDERFQTAESLAAALRAQRPAGPELSDWLQSRGSGPRAVSSLSGGPMQGAAIDATLVAADQGSTLRGSAVPPLPQLDEVPQARQLPLAVLLFRWLGEPADDYLAHGLTEEITDRLSNSEGLRVIGYRVVRSIASDSRDMSEVAQKLSVKVVLEGILRPTENGLVATVRLLDIDSKLQFAARRFECPDRNILALSSDVARVIGDLLTISLEPSRSALASDPVAVDLYLRARHQYHRLSMDTSRQSLALLDLALQRLPDEPTLLTAMAMALSRSWFFADEGAGERGMQAALRAVELAPESGEAHLALAMLLINGARFEEAALSLRRALALSPRLVEAHEALGQLISDIGPLDLAMRHLKYALLLDRSIPRIRISLVRTAMLSGQPEAALAYLGRPGTEFANLPVLWVTLTRVLAWSQDLDRVRALLQDPELQRPDFKDVRSRLEHIAGTRDVPIDEFFPQFYRLPSASRRAHQFAKQIFTEYYCASRKYGLAFEALRDAVELGMTDLMWLERCPLLAPLRQDKGFPALHDIITERAKRIRRALGISDA